MGSGKGHNKRANKIEAKEQAVTDLSPEYWKQKLDSAITIKKELSSYIDPMSAIFFRPSNRYESCDYFLYMKEQLKISDPDENIIQYIPSLAQYYLGKVSGSYSKKEIEFIYTEIMKDLLTHQLLQSKFFDPTTNAYKHEDKMSEKNIDGLNKLANLDLEIKIQTLKDEKRNNAEMQMIIFSYNDNIIMEPNLVAKSSSLNLLSVDTDIILNDPIININSQASNPLVQRTAWMLEELINPPKPDSP